MAFIREDEAQRLLARARAVKCERNEALTVTSGYLDDEYLRRYFVLIDDVKLPATYLYFENPR